MEASDNPSKLPICIEVVSDGMYIRLDIMLPRSPNVTLDFIYFFVPSRIPLQDNLASSIMQGYDRSSVFNLFND